MTPARTSSKGGDDQTVGGTGLNGVEHRPSGIHPAPGRKARRAKWTVVDQFDRGGHRYQLRCRPIEQRGEGALLTEREEEVLACALDGHSNKSIAYELGVAPSTVGVLLFRAATKLGVKSRRDLLSIYARRKTSSTEGPPEPANPSHGMSEAPALATGRGERVRKRRVGCGVDPSE